MCKKMKKWAAMAAIMLQIMVMLLFGFTEIPVSAGAYMAVWCACAVFVKHMLERSKVI